MNNRRGTKTVTRVDKTPKVPMPTDLEESVVKTTEELIEEKKVEEVEAIVDGVDMALNIRKDPEKKPNNQIAILGKGTKIIVVDPKKTIKNKDGEWYKVRLKNKEKEEEHGYALKKYIRVV